VSRHHRDTHRLRRSSKGGFKTGDNQIQIALVAICLLFLAAPVGAARLLRRRCSKLATAFLAFGNALEDQFFGTPVRVPPSRVTAALALAKIFSAPFFLATMLAQALTARVEILVPLFLSWFFGDLIALWFWWCELEPANELASRGRRGNENPLPTGTLSDRRRSRTTGTLPPSTSDDQPSIDPFESADPGDDS
jgi:hypothetical protein